ncbi:hypothetical protein GGX14DRAFT_408894 [Mycena pura]|uniref:Uncharacterized protein n=1 Tax=Mycena pura TaxID=153505 RepID=A0AAD6UK24_9AGAR|nr:hypothetical protein GGX14DRAFT_408894 [Mycena pura]
MAGSRTGRGRGRGGTAPTRQSTRKRVASDPEEPAVETLLDSAPPAKKPKKTPAPLEPRAPSKRAGRVLEPGKPDKPKEYRTHEVVQAEKDAAATAEEARLRRRADLVAELANIDVEGDLAHLEEEENAIMTRDDLHEPDAAGDAKDDVFLIINESDFDNLEDDDAYRSEGGFVPKKACRLVQAKAPVVPKRKKKPAKGETKAEVDALAKALLAKTKKDGKGKKAVQDNNAAAASKKAGLSKRFLAASAKTTESPGKLVVGGLTDEDAKSARPDFSRPTSPADRERERVNDLVEIRDNSDMEDDTPTQTIPMAIRRPAAKPKTALKLPALTFESTSKTKSKKQVKEESSFTPATSNDLKGLPALVGPTWESEFLPAAYRALSVSRHPMTFAAKGESASSQSEAVAAIQAILDEIHPGNSFVVVWGDQICDRAVKRIRERRTLIAQRTLDTVAEFFAADEYANDRMAIRTYARYAVRPDGPGFWKHPAPSAGPPDPKAAGYIKPAGCLESPLIIAAASMFLKTEEYALPDRVVGGAYDSSGMPRGLFSLLAAGTERALKLYTANGVRAPVPKFTRAAVGTSVAGYGNNIDRFTRSRWESLLLAAGAPTAGVLASGAEAINDNLRDTMYIPSSSPARAF